VHNPTREIARPHYQSHSHLHSQKWQQMINWINQFEEPSCLLVNQVSDLSTGVALCHIVANITCSEQERQELTELINPIKPLQNVGLALEVLKASDCSLAGWVKTIRAEDVLRDNGLLFELLEALREV